MSSYLSASTCYALSSSYYQCCFDVVAATGCCVELGGVFKAHIPRDETKDAEEVTDTNETKHDIPVDLQDAVPVEVKYYMYSRTFQQCRRQLLTRSA